MKRAVAGLNPEEPRVTAAWPSLSAIVPVYNEGAILRASLAQIDGFLARHFSRRQIILIESGSTDGSAALCDEFAAGRPHVTVIHEPVRNGFGAAVKLGIAAAACDLVCVVSSDLTYPLEALLAAVPLMERHDCVLSYRSHDPRCLGRRIQSAFYNRLARILLGLRVRNVNSALKLFRRDFIQTVPLRSNGWFIDTEICCRLEQRGLSCAEIPVPFTDRAGGVSSVPWLAPLHMLAELLRFRRRLRAEAAVAARRSAS